MAGPGHFTIAARTSAPEGHNQRRHMRSSKSRSRNKSNRQRTIGNIINRVFDSSGPEGKVRGTPQQIIDKYLALARDAQLGNDRVAEQNFLQHAEHYTRMLGEAQREIAREQEERQRNYQQGGSGQNNGQTGGQNGGNRDRQERPEREAEPRYEAATDALVTDALVTEETGTEESGLVETPEMRAETRPAETPAEPEGPAQQVAEAFEVADEATPAPETPEQPEAEAPPRRARAPRRTPRKPRAPKKTDADAAQLPLDAPTDASGE